MATYIKPNAIKDASIEGIKIKDGTISSSKIDGTVASKNYVDDTIKANIATQITYTDLKALRDAGKLVPGTQYRITDYTCTTTQANTKSAGHQFDIIVKADSENKLNEESSAIQHTKDDIDYFANSDLSAWKLWYCLDNDTTRFAWADSTNGKGVIYRMIDEWNNDVPYDFKNIQYNGSWGYWAYTFNWQNDASDNSCEDLSVAQYAHTNDEGGYSHTYGNVIKPCELGETNYGVPFKLNACVFLNTEAYDSGLFYGCYSNVFGNNCQDNVFGNGCYSNVFGNVCYSNVFGNVCYSNVFGNVCYSNVFGNNCYNNTFGDGCYNNTFGDGCDCNTFGDDCDCNTFGDDCDNNTFGNDCDNNVFGNDCDNNVFGNNCQDNVFRDNCYSNVFGNNCQDNVFGNNCQDNVFGNDCDFIIFASDRTTATKYNYYQQNHFGEGCQYIVFTGAETASSSAQVQNYNFAQGLKGTSSSYLTIDGVRNRAYETYISKDTDGTIKESVIAEKLDKVIEISYNDLVTLRGSSKLVPGQQYRITDYTCTTAQEDTRSAGHQFDVIVTAVSKNKLNENARAIQHIDDTYFANSKLESWELKYCLDNDTTRFAWADATNGKGVIYWMKDEYDNECPYDFKNIQFKRYILNAADAFATDVVKDGELAAVKEKLNVMSHRIHTNLWYYGEYVTDVYPDAEEGKKYVPFGDIMYNYNGPGVLCPINEANSIWNFTFSDDGGNDNTLTSQGNIHNNVIKNNKFLLITSEGEGRYSFEEQNNVCLNDIIFIGNNCHSNTFENDCLSNTFGNDCQQNTFGNNCYYNTFGNYFQENTFGNYCWNNTFGNNCYYNTFGNNCYYNTFGNDCSRNTFGNGCYSNTFGNNCSRNTFGNGCYSNTFGNNCNNNTFGNDCDSNTFGNSFQYNTFGNNCNNNTFGNYIQESQFGDGVQYFSITTQQMATNPTSSYLKNYIRRLIVENGVSYVNAYVTGTTSDTSYCQNVRICLGIQGIDSANRKTFDITSCINSKLNNVYQPANSQTTSV